MGESNISLLPLRLALNVVGLLFSLVVLRYSQVKAALCLGLYFLWGIVFRLLINWGLLSLDHFWYEIGITIDLAFVVFAIFFIMQSILIQIKKGS